MITQRGACLIHDTQSWSRSSACTAALGDKWLVGWGGLSWTVWGRECVQEAESDCHLLPHQWRSPLLVPQVPSDSHLSLLAPAPAPHTPPPPCFLCSATAVTQGEAPFHLPKLKPCRLYLFKGRKEVFTQRGLWFWRDKMLLSPVLLLLSCGSQHSWKGLGAQTALP